MEVVGKSTVEVKLNNGLVAIIDADDLEKVSRYNWNAPTPQRGTIYAMTVADCNRLLSMHRLIMDAERGTRVDHVNGNGLDNRRCNLRFATRTQNAANTSKPKKSGCTSIYKGVFYERSGKLRKRWRALIKVDGKKLYQGNFATEAEAARAYDKAALEHFGEYARLNF